MTLNKVRVCMYTNIYSHINACVCVHVQANMYACMHTHARMHTHTHTHRVELGCNVMKGTA